MANAPEGVVGAEETPTTEVGSSPATEEGGNQPSELQVEEEVSASQKELKSFLRWVRKGNHKRKFNFEAVEPDLADVLNKYVAVGDFDAARWHAENYLGI